jgi:hypothetical protein
MLAILNIVLRILLSMTMQLLLLLLYYHYDRFKICARQTVHRMSYRRHVCNYL